MGIAISLRDYLDNAGYDYDVQAHERTSFSIKTAKAGHIPGDQLAKAVILEDADGYLMAIIPSTHKVNLGALHRQLHRHVGLATEQELADIFDDCELGAIPAVGQAYGMDGMIDDSLSDQKDIFFEGGKHTDVVHLTGEDFDRLMDKADHAIFSRHR